MRVAEYRKMFTPASRPDARTVRRWVAEGNLYGEQRGRVLYVDPDRRVAPAPRRELSTLARKVLEG